MFLFALSRRNELFLTHELFLTRVTHRDTYRETRKDVLLPTRTTSYASSQQRQHNKRVRVVGFTRERRKQRDIVHGDPERRLGPNLRFAARGAVTRRPRAVWVRENDVFERFEWTSERKHHKRREFDEVCV